MEGLDKTDPALIEMLRYMDHRRGEEYAYGRCTVFALALHNLYRYQIELLWGQPKNLGSATMPAIHSGLQHAFCIRKDGSLVDARGSVDREQIITEYGEGQEPRWQRVSKAELLSLANQGNASRPDNGELFILRCYILQNQDVYKMGTRSIEPLRDVRDQFDVKSISTRINDHNQKIILAQSEAIRAAVTGEPFER